MSYKPSCMQTSIREHVTLRQYSFEIEKPQFSTLGLLTKEGEAAADLRHLVISHCAHLAVPHPITEHHDARRKGAIHLHTTVDTVGVTTITVLEKSKLTALCLCYLHM